MKPLIFQDDFQVGSGVEKSGFPKQKWSISLAAFEAELSGYS